MVETKVEGMLPGVTPKDRTRCVLCIVASARWGHTWDMSTKEGLHSRHLSCKAQRTRRGTKAQSRFRVDQTKLRDNLAVY